jgi:integrase
VSPRAPQKKSTTRRRGNSEGSTPRRRPDGRWQINLRVTDEFGDSSRHTVYGDTAQDARDRAAEIRKRVEDGQPARDRRETVAAFTQHWIDTSLQASERKRNTKVMYAGVARTHILNSSIGRLSLDKVRRSHVEGWVVELRRKGLAQSTIRSAYTILRAVLDTAVRDGALASNPAAVIRRPRVMSQEAPNLTPTQVAELLRAAEGSRYASLFALLVHTGLRRGEALALQWSDVDLARGMLRVRGTLSRIDGELLVTEPKTAKSKRTYPSPHLPSGCSATCTPPRPRSGPWPGRPGARPASCSPRSSASPATLGTPFARSRSRPPGPACQTWGCTRSDTPRPA